MMDSQTYRLLYDKKWIDLYHILIVIIVVAAFGILLKKRKNRPP